MTEPLSSTDTIFQVLAHEHRDLEARFAALYEQAALDFDGAHGRYPQLCGAILAHVRAEAAVLHPRLAAIGELEPLLARNRTDLARIEADAKYLARAQLTPSEWLRALRRLEADFDHLIEREETHVYPAARRAMSLELSHALARELRTVEQRERDTM